jgi:hypothetical protein
MTRRDGYTYHAHPDVTRKRAGEPISVPRSQILMPVDFCKQKLPLMDNVDGYVGLVGTWLESRPIEKVEEFEYLGRVVTKHDNRKDDEPAAVIRNLEQEARAGRHVYRHLRAHGSTHRLSV